MRRMIELTKFLTKLYASLISQNKNSKKCQYLHKVNVPGEINFMSIRQLINII